MTPPPTTAPARPPARTAPRRPRPAARPHRAGLRARRGPASRTRGRRTAAAAALPFGSLAERAVAAVCTVRDSQMVDRLVRGQGWIALLGVLLIGLVGLNVSLLKLNAHNGRTRRGRARPAHPEREAARLGLAARLERPAAGGGAQRGPRDALAADGQLPDHATRAPTGAAPRRTCAWTCRRPPTSSSSAPRPRPSRRSPRRRPPSRSWRDRSRDAGGRSTERPARPASSHRRAHRCNRRHWADRHAGRLGPGREASRGATRARHSGERRPRDGRHAHPQSRGARPNPAAARAVAARLTERRIGLMFAIFLVRARRSRRCAPATCWRSRATASRRWRPRSTCRTSR